MFSKERIGFLVAEFQLAVRLAQFAEIENIVIKQNLITSIVRERDRLNNSCYKAEEELDFPIALAEFQNRVELYNQQRALNKPDFQKVEDFFSMVEVGDILSFKDSQSKEYRRIFYFGKSGVEIQFLSCPISNRQVYQGDLKKIPMTDIQEVKIDQFNIEALKSCMEEEKVLELIYFNKQVRRKDREYIVCGAYNSYFALQQVTTDRLEFFRSPVAQM